ncbi:MAG: hypothetical protein K2Y05_06920 [Hyphomicrobiaceae bacterium]|nr:hypothetical protein [Hyphomicrobiaceae bacterium]
MKGFLFLNAMPTTALVALALALAFVGHPASAGPAIGQFEVKDLESEPGDLQFQSQNAISAGQPRRRSMDVDKETRFDPNTVMKERYALELQASVTTWFRGRVGIEFEKSRLDEVPSAALADAFGSLELSNAAVEGIFILVPPKEGRIGLGVLTEYERGITEKLDLFYAGPILTYVTGSWSAMANLLIVQHLRAVDRKRDFAYAAQLQHTISPSWAVALEAYGTIDRLGTSGRKSEDVAGFPDFDQHRLGPVVYYRWGSELGSKSAARHRDFPAQRASSRDDDAGALASADDDKEPVSIGAGVLFGLNGNTPDRTLKLSLEVEF